MANIKLTVTDFTFPADLKDKFAAFRLSVFLRYLDKDDKLVDVMEVIPGVGDSDFWECEKGNKKKQNFVRHATLPKIDITKVSESRREALFAGINFKSLERVTVKIYDIEKDGKWDKAFREGLKLAFGVGLSLATGGGAITVGNALKELNKKLGKDAERSEVEKKFIEIIDASAKKGRSRLLWEQSADIEGMTSGDPFAVTGNSQLGIFTVDFASRIK
jgi:hypothetical protein